MQAESLNKVSLIERYIAVLAVHGESWRKCVVTLKQEYYIFVGGHKNEPWGAIRLGGFPPCKPSWLIGAVHLTFLLGHTSHTIERQTQRRL